MLKIVYLWIVVQCRLVLLFALQTLFKVSFNVTPFIFFIREAPKHSLQGTHTIKAKTILLQEKPIKLQLICLVVEIKRNVHATKRHFIMFYAIFSTGKLT